MKPPILVLDDTGLALFTSREAAERKMEAVDVRAGLFRAAFDSTGLRLGIGLKATTRTSRLPFLRAEYEQVTLRPLEEAPTGEIEAKNAVLTYLERVDPGYAMSRDAASLQELLNVVIARLGHDD